MEESKEFSVVQCKVCEKIQKRYLKGKYKSGKDKIWEDAEGRKFNGRVCPQCHSDMLAEKQLAKRRLNKALNETMKEAFDEQQ